MNLEGLTKKENITHPSSQPFLMSMPLSVVGKVTSLKTVVWADEG